MQLSNRLKAVEAMLNRGRYLVDVGTDHGYIPIDLIQKGVIERAIAMDIGEGPLQRAREHINQCGMENSIQTRLSDGVKNLQPGEADCMVIAGMGGALTIHILSEGAEQILAMKECILQPQSEVAKVRRYLWKHNFTIEAEDMVLEEDKFYPMMRVIPNQKQVISAEKQELYAAYGPCLIEQRHPVLRLLLEREKERSQNLSMQLVQHLPNTQKRLDELNKKQVLIHQALDFINHS